MQDWEIVIGLEIHTQLKTKSKIFSGASTDFGAAPNTQACAIDLGFPGVLPTVNTRVYEKAVAFGLAIGATINLTSVFDRKNYFYPDSPKGYQITQLETPIVVGGSVDIILKDGSVKTIQVTRAHLEEDAGKSMHEDYHGKTGIDLNRAGTPLLEIVSEPDMRSAEEAVAYARYIHQLVTYLGVSDGDMSQGSLRCDANVSIRPMGTRTETKNVNSFRFLERAINHEVERQIAVLESGGRIRQETRLYDSDKDETRPMRSKETATDYRYFPEPDLLPIHITQDYIETVRQQMPELPEAKIQRFVRDYDLNEADAEVLASTVALADYFETVARVGGDAKLAANWVRVELLGQMNRDSLTPSAESLSAISLSANALGMLLARIKDGTISGKIAKTVFAALWHGEATDPDTYIATQGLTQVSNSNELIPIVDSVIENNPQQAAQYREGKTKLIGFFVGQVMRQTAGKANPQQVSDLVQQRLLD